MRELWYNPKRDELIIIPNGYTNAIINGYLFTFTYVFKPESFGWIFIEDFK